MQILTHDVYNDMYVVRAAANTSAAAAHVSFWNVYTTKKSGKYDYSAIIMLRHIIITGGPPVRYQYGRTVSRTDV